MIRALLNRIRDYRFQRAIKPFREAERNALMRGDTRAINKAREKLRYAVHADLRSTATGWRSGQ